VSDLPFPIVKKPQVPIGLVIFGATGDLTRRKLVPALYQLALADQLPDNLHIIGFARRDWDAKKMREEMQAGLEEHARTKPLDAKVLKRILECMHFVSSVFDDPAGYQKLDSLLDKLGADNRLFYLATPPNAYATIIEQIGNAKLASCDQGWTRIVVEKPYGRDLESAKSLDEVVHTVFNEEQVYRIDHYLGKETVQNILVFRFANGIFEPLWNRRYIDSVQITVAETVGVGTRAGYYETAGVVRDMFQNHILQLLTLTAMEAPTTFSADAVRDEKVKVLKALHPMTGEDVRSKTLRAQYAGGTINGKKRLAYKSEEGVAKGSTTETFLAAKIEIDNWRWAGVPFFIRSGKSLPERVTEIAVQYKQVPLSLFGWKNMAGEAPNRLVLRLQPDEGITLSFGAKVPGPENRIAGVEMDFSYEDTFGGGSPEAYERLLMDCMNGDATLFTRSDEVLSAWGFVSDIIKGWDEQKLKNLPEYSSGSWGPKEMEEFIQRSDGEWRQL
jgi:glucose-6-phosphate 1-dehydrogenase